MCLEYYKLFDYSIDDVGIQLVENVSCDTKSILKKSLEKYKKSRVTNLGIRKMINCECGTVYYKCHESEHLFSLLSVAKPLRLEVLGVADKGGL